MTVVAAAGLFALASCGNGAAGNASSSEGHGESGTAAAPGIASVSGTTDVTLAEVASSPREQVPSALDDPAAPGLPKPLIDPSAIESGGPPPDGIPAIDHPHFDRADRVNWLAPKEPVLALQIGNDARAYPVQVLIWHEIVNDAVDGIPVAVTYCPLCNTAIAYNRKVGDRVLDFGTSGKLYDSNMVAYDRQTQSLWLQFSGQAIAGALTATQLHDFPLSTVSWSDWHKQNPYGWVLDRDTGYKRPYGENPYPGYDDINGSPFLFDGPTDPRLAAMTRVVGLQSGDDAVAVVLSSLRQERVEEIQLQGSPVVVWEQPGTASALSNNQVADGPEVGATGAFDPVLDGRHLHFMAVDNGFRDVETGSTWNVLGRATAGPLVSQQLHEVPLVDTFWFVLAAFLPKTRIVGK